MYGAFREPHGRERALRNVSSSEANASASSERNVKKLTTVGARVDHHPCAAAAYPAWIEEPFDPVQGALRLCAEL